MLNRKTRLFLIILIFSLFSFSLNAHVNFFTPERPALTLQGGLSAPFRGDLRNHEPAFDTSFSADFKELYLDSGIKYQNNQFDFTSRAFYTPTFFNAFQAGLGFTWHIYRYTDTFTENDLLLTARFNWIKGPVFSFKGGGGLLFKFASIDAVKEYKPYIYNMTYNLDFLFNWHVFSKTDLWFALRLQDYYDYPLAISPFIKFGFDYAILPALTFGADYTLKYIDMFFSAVYLNESVLRLSFKVAL